MSKNLLIFTDIGDDIDDSLAITHLIKHTAHNICGIVLTHGDIEHRYQEITTLLSHLGTTIPLIKGSSLPLAQNEDDTTSQHLLQHIPANMPITVLCLCAATDLAKTLIHMPTVKKQIEHIWYQWTITTENNQHVADLSSYNFRTDPKAIAYCLDSNIPFSFITKQQAYAQPRREKEFLNFTDSPAINNYLLTKAHERQLRFQQLNPTKRAEIYGHDATILSFPYDLLVAKRV
jgi:inosine-uridine nucleoside N-ribohydrolase